MSDRFVGFGVPRACACVVRGTETEREILVFDHPGAGIQIPKGRIEDGEPSAEAASRELAEESGLDLEPTRYIGLINRKFNHPATGEIVEEEWHCWLFHAPPDVQESWIHVPDEEGIAFSYRWIVLDDHTAEIVHPHFSDVIELAEQTQRMDTSQ